MKNRPARVIPLLLSVALAACLLLSACGAAVSPAASAPPTAAESAAAEPSFTPAELASYDGQNGNKAYIAVDGVVYDVTALSQWGSALHAGKFAPGKDYSAEIKSAPHPVSYLLRAVRVGTLSD